MSSYSQSKAVVARKFFKPVVDLYPNSKRRYSCVKLGDLDFIESLVARCLSREKSGRGFLQKHSDHGRNDIKTDLFFNNLSSQRRLDNLQSINRLITPMVNKLCKDDFAEMKEFDDFDIYAGDGHFHTASVHDPVTLTSKGNPIKRATGHFYMANLRNLELSVMTSALSGGTRKGEHDMHAIKRCTIDELRRWAKKGRKVIIVWDKAGIDFAYWDKLKKLYGVYFVSLEKENMKLVKSYDRTYDKNDPRNEGVIADEAVSPGSGGNLLRRVIYRDPLTGTVYNYLTTNITLEPWAIVLLYKKRWDIEKVFDELKNKMNEQKSWSKSKVGKRMQAETLCLTHNLALLMEEYLRKEEGVENVAEFERKKKRVIKAKKNGGNFISTALQRFTVRTIKFIRWLDNFFYQEVPWEHAVDRLRLRLSKL